MAVMAQSLSKWAIYFSYQINKDYISKNLCENRMKPGCCCHGKCYLAKQLAKDQNNQQSAGKNAQKEEVSLIYFCDHSAPLHFLQPVKDSPVFISVKDNLANRSGT